MQREERDEPGEPMNTASLCLRSGLSWGSFSGRAGDQVCDGVVLLPQLDNGLPPNRPLHWPLGTSQPRRKRGKITLVHPLLAGEPLGAFGTEERRHITSSIFNLQVS